MSDPAMCPECRNGKCGNCDGTAWNEETDEPTVCVCHTTDHPGWRPA